MDAKIRVSRARSSANRASVFGTEGRGFESLRARHLPIPIAGSSRMLTWASVERGRRLVDMPPMQRPPTADSERCCRPCHIEPACFAPPSAVNADAPLLHDPERACQRFLRQ